MRRPSHHYNGDSDHTPFTRMLNISARLPLLWMTVLFATASCFFTSQQYPSDWVGIESGKSAGPQGCPIITGIYQDFGITEPQNKFKGRHWDQVSLIYNLLSKGPDQMRGRRDVGQATKDVEHLIGNPVEIKQHSDDLVEIIVWQKGTAEPFMITDHFLWMSKGDFSCDSEGLHLKTRKEALIVGISNFVGWTSRTFNRSADGSLVMKGKQSGFGHHTLLPLGAGVEYWIRWSPASESSP